jgi:hypothetical protein
LIFAAVTLLSLTAFGGAAAQDAAASLPPGERADSVFAHIWPPDPTFNTKCVGARSEKELTRESIFLRASIADSARTALTTQTDLMAQEVAEAMRAHMGGSSDSLPNGDGIVHTASVPAELVVIAHPDGRDRRYARSLIGDTSATAMLVRAFDETRAHGDALLVWPDGYSADSIVVRLLLGGMPVKYASSVIVQFQSHPAFGVFRLLEYTSAPPFPKEHNPAPVYPDGGRLRRVGVTLELQFVVDSSGDVEAETIRDIWPADKPNLTGELLRYYDDFVDVSKRAVGDWKFYPARVGSCHVKHFMRIPIQFTMK